MTESDGRRQEPGLPSIEEIRSRLQAMGYLQSPVERFLGRPAGGPWLTGLSITLKVSVLAGALLAGLTTASTLLADPAFIGNSLDVLLFFIYLGAIFSALIFGLVLAPAIFWVRKRQRSLGLRSGGALRATVLSVGVAALLCVYLLGWWHIEVTESSTILPLGPASLSVLAGIALVSLMASRLFGFVYFLLAGAPEFPRSRKSRPARSYLFSLIVITVIEGAWTAGIYRYHSADHTLASALQDYSVRPLPVLLVGVDGLDSESLFRLTGSGRLPNLTRLIREGFSADLETQRSYLAPQVWTTIATGVKPDRHGINNFTLPVLRGMSRQPRLAVVRPGFAAALGHLFPFFRLVRPVPLSGSTRLARTLWEIIELFHAPAGVVNWWATWPAGQTPGFRISERTFPKIALLLRNETQNPATIYEQEVYPKEEFDSLAILCFGLAGAFDKRLADLPEISHLLRDSLPESTRNLISSVYFTDYFYTHAAAELARRHRVLFLTLYLQGPDILSRLRERTDLIDPSRLKAVIPEYYTFVDSLLGELIRSYQPSGLVAVVCEPGKSGRELGLKGAAVFSGIDVRRNARAEEPLALEDIAPTMLYLIGLPVSRGMGGHARTEAGVPGPGGTMPLHYVTTYGPPMPDTEPTAAYRHDREVIERWRSLGYLK